MLWPNLRDYEGDTLADVVVSQLPRISHWVLTSGNLISETAGQVGGEELGVSEMAMSLYVEKTGSEVKDGGEEEESNLNTLCNQALSVCSTYMREALFLQKRKLRFREVSYSGGSPHPHLLRICSSGSLMYVT